MALNASSPKKKQGGSRIKGGEPKGRRMTKARLSFMLMLLLIGCGSTQPQRPGSEFLRVEGVTDEKAFATAYMACRQQAQRSLQRVQPRSAGGEFAGDMAAATVGGVLFGAGAAYATGYYGADKLKHGLKEQNQRRLKGEELTPESYGMGVKEKTAECLRVEGYKIVVDEMDEWLQQSRSSKPATAGASTAPQAKQPAPSSSERSATDRLQELEALHKSGDENK